MAQDKPATDGKAVLDRAGLTALIAALSGSGYQVIGPQVTDGIIAYEPLDPGDDLPVGWSDEQDGGKYRLVKAGRDSLFDYVVGQQSWKKYLYPPVETLWEARREEGRVTVTPKTETQRYAFIGVRPCEIAAMQVQDRVLMDGEFVNPGYRSRRQAAFIVAVNCARPGGTCFCASMDSGPRATQGFDLALTELIDDRRHEFLVETGSALGAELLAALPKRAAAAADVTAADRISKAVAGKMGRAMVPDVAPLMLRNLEDPRWTEIAKRCLGCTNCTMVCPTCFCGTVEDSADVPSQTTTRRRRWDSCFSIEFSYIHGGSIRREGFSRYRQWMTHKLAHWHDQFGTSGCVGCGRCITWCPVGIDITEEARAFRENERE